MESGLCGLRLGNSSKLGSSGSAAVAGGTEVSRSGGSTIVGMGVVSTGSYRLRI